MKKIILLLICGLFIQLGYSQSISTDRPDQSDSPVILEKNKFQMETGILNDKEKTSFGTLLRYGLFDYAEIGIWSSYDFIKNKNGMTPFTVRSKVHISEEHGIFPQLALVTYLAFPNEVVFGINSLTPSILLAGSNTLSNNVSLSYNFGSIWEDSPYAEGKYTICLGWSLQNDLSIFGETFGEFNKTEFSFATDVGLLYLINNNFQIDISGGFGIINSFEYFISCGFSYKL